MSKEKSSTGSGVSTRGRYSYRIIRPSPSAASDGSSEKPAPAKRVCLGGRGREWAAESLKLLETMCELDDAKIVLEPMNPLKYSEYYNMIRDPIDLSKIMLKFHGGAYPGLHHFSDDMASMFDNYKRFFSDSSDEAYHQVRRLGAWFETELDQIKTKWYRICDNGTRIVNSYGVYPSRTGGSLEARIQAIEAENKRLTLANLNSKASVPIRLAPVDSRTVKFPQTLNAVPLSKSNGSGGVNGAPVLTFRLADASGSLGASNTSVKLPTSGNSKPILFMSKPSENGNGSMTQGGVMYMCADWPPKQTGLKSVGVVGGGSTSLPPKKPGSHLATTLPPAAVSPKNQNVIDSSSGSGLTLEVNSIWFGAARNQLTEPVSVDEEGFHFCFKNGEADFPFTIGRDEIIKCAAYFGNIQKHTLFLFVLPNSVRRLQPLGEEFTQSSLIIMFTRALTQSQIAKFVYLFWRMSRLSMFGELFCEIDQKSALALLGNIKPTIISNVSDKLKDVLNSSLDVQQGMAGKHGSCSIQQNSKAIGDARTLFDGVDEFTEVDCKVEPVDDDLSLLGSDEMNSSCLNMGLEPIIHTRDKLSPDGGSNKQNTSVENSIIKSDVIHKRLKIRYKPGILRRSKRRVNERKQLHEEDELEKQSEGSKTSDNCQMEEEGENQFTIIEWFPGPEDGNVTGDESLASEISRHSDLQRIRGSKEENDLEIVAPLNESDAEMDVSDAAEGREDLVMTGEKINIRCPITQQVMEYPVKNIHCNHCYDKQGVEDLVKHRGDKAKCPVTGCSNTLPLQMEDVKYDYQLAFYIQQKQLSSK